MRLIGERSDLGAPPALYEIGTRIANILDFPEKLFDDGLHPLRMVGTCRESLPKAIPLFRGAVGAKNQVIVVEQKHSCVTSNRSKVSAAWRSPREVHPRLRTAELHHQIYCLLQIVLRVLHFGRDSERWLLENGKNQVEMVPPMIEENTTPCKFGTLSPVRGASTGTGRAKNGEEDGLDHTNPFFPDEAGSLRPERRIFPVVYRKDDPFRPSGSLCDQV